MPSEWIFVATRGVAYHLYGCGLHPTVLYQVEVDIAQGI